MKLKNKELCIASRNKTDIAGNTAEAVKERRRALQCIDTFIHLSLFAHTTERKKRKHYMCDETEKHFQYLIKIT